MSAAAEGKARSARRCAIARGRHEIVHLAVRPNETDA
jgi:hypothetical protein